MAGEFASAAFQAVRDEHSVQPKHTTCRSRIVLPVPRHERRSLLTLPADEAVEPDLAPYFNSDAAPEFTVDDLQAFAAIIRTVYRERDVTDAVVMLFRDHALAPESSEEHREALRVWRNVRNAARPIGRQDADRADTIIANAVDDLLGEVIRRAVMIAHLCAPEQTGAISDEIERCASVRYHADHLRILAIEWPTAVEPPTDLERLNGQLVPLMTSAAGRELAAIRLRALLTGRTALKSLRGRPASTGPFWMTRYLESALPSARSPYRIAAAIAARFRFDTRALRTVIEGYRLGSAKRKPIRLDRLAALYNIGITAY